VPQAESISFVNDMAASQKLCFWTPANGDEKAHRTTFPMGYKLTLIETEEQTNQDASC
jgi:hypothetical protein